MNNISPTNYVTGNFTAVQQLDMIGYWNIFAIDGHIRGRLFAKVALKIQRLHYPRQTLT
ncbi:MAG: hypothetical protein WC046_03775 [Candidatus Bathyarchaeia archaeon]